MQGSIEAVAAGTGRTIVSIVNGRDSKASHLAPDMPSGWLMPDLSSRITDFLRHKRSRRPKCGAQFCSEPETAEQSCTMSDVRASEANPGGSAAACANAEPCPGCRRSLPIRRARPGETASHWECSACNAPLTGILLKNAAADMASTIRIGQVQLDTAGVPALPTSLRQLVREFVDSRSKNPPASERRKSTRVPRELDVTVLMLDDEWMPRAKPVPGVVVDLSAHGVGLVSTTKIESRYVILQIRLPAGLLQILGEVVWTKDIGHGFFNSGAQFLLRFGRSTGGNGQNPSASATQ